MKSWVATGAVGSQKIEVTVKDVGFADVRPSVGNLIIQVPDTFRSEVM